MLAQLSLVQMLLRCCTQVWCLCMVRKLDRVQRRCMRVELKVKKSCHVVARTPSAASNKELRETWSVCMYLWRTEVGLWEFGVADDECVRGNQSV